MFASFVCLLISSLPHAFAEGGLSLSQTRVVFDEKAKSVKVTLYNQSDRVYLINGRVQDTSDAMTAATAIPFMVTPPLFRLEKDSRNTVLVVHQDTSALPKDRESVYYLSFLAIPAVQKKDTQVQDTLQPSLSVGIRSTIKLFYRPSGLILPVNVAPEKLQFQQQNQQLQVDNFTPYYQTLATLTVNQQPIDVRQVGAMLAPFTSQYYPVSGSVQQVSWSIIDDFGGISPVYHLKINHGEQ